MMIVQNQAQELACVQQQLARHSMKISRTTYRLRQIATVFRDNLVITPAQCQAAILHLGRLRVKVQHCSTLLLALNPQVTERVRPYGCIEKLGSLEERLTELLLFLAMFLPICQSISPERVETHLLIRAKFPALLTSFHDAKSQLFTLFSAERMGR